MRCILGIRCLPDSAAFKRRFPVWGRWARCCWSTGSNMSGKSTCYGVLRLKRFARPWRAGPVCCGRSAVAARSRWRTDIRVQGRIETHRTCRFTMSEKLKCAFWQPSSGTRGELNAAFTGTLATSVTAPVCVFLLDEGFCRARTAASVRSPVDAGARDASSKAAAIGAITTHSID